MDQFWTQVQYWEEGLHSLLHQSNGKYKCIRKDVGGPNNAGNILIPISTEQPALTQSTFHPVAPGHATSNTLTGRNTDQVPLAIPKNKPVQTNKFYTSLLIGKQDLTCWTQPYSVTWAKGNGNAKSYGLSISHIDRSQIVSGGTTVTGAAQFYLAPVGIQSIILSAAELGKETSVSTENHGAFTVDANFSSSAGGKTIISFPLVLGMGFITASYRSGTPLVQSSVGFQTFTASGTVNGSSTAKYTVKLVDGNTWLVYVTPNSGVSQPTLNLNNGVIQAAAAFSGTVQVAKLPKDGCPSIYDRSAGVYPTYCTVTAKVDGNAGSYTFSWQKDGLKTNPLLLFALSHHVDSFDSKTASSKQKLQLYTVTKGIATAVQADNWTMVESSLPTSLGFSTWSSQQAGPNPSISTAAIDLINKVAANEVDEDFDKQTNLDSMYYSGKALTKYAMLAFALQQVAKNEQLASTALNKLKKSFAVFVENRQKTPLVYDTVWKGVISSAGLTGDKWADFGNSMYNDHHFHYGYFVYAAAIISYLDPTWPDQGTNKQWVNTLIRDYANAVDNDGFFPFSRSFDWYHGHSWAQGLAESADGKDQESSSEDALASYAIKLWGHVTSDASLEARGNLMLAIHARTIPLYYLMDKKNTIHPAEFIGNKAVGILFENKCDHATFFGNNPEYIQGIHMIPMNPSSALTRPKQFVQEEWDAYFSNGRVDKIEAGWRGILYANLALIDPATAYAFFAQDKFDASWIDGGASRTWYLAYTAALAGA